MGKFSDIKLATVPRATLRASLVSSGVPVEHVDEVADLALKAAEDARQTVFRTVDSASDPAVSLCAFGIAFSIVQSDAQHLVESQKDYAKSSGANLHEVKLEVANG